MPDIFHKSKKKQLQDIIDKNEMELNDFSFTSPSLMSYKIKYIKTEGYVFQIDKKSPNFDYSEYRGDPNSGKRSSAKWEIILGIFENWLGLIRTEQATILHEDIKQHRNFPVTINTISLEFEKIYNQALKAEADKLDEICGMGYRKAFEFLLKDYLVCNKKITQSVAEEIFKLQICVDKLKDNYIMHKLAKYTAYLGNDFSHYYRKWVNKEIKDLKQMIDILIDWIDTTESHKQKLQIIESKAEEKVKEFASQN